MNMPTVAKARQKTQRGRAETIPASGRNSDSTSEEKFIYAHSSGTGNENKLHDTMQGLDKKRVNYIFQAMERDPTSKKKRAKRRNKTPRPNQWYGPELKPRRKPTTKKFRAEKWKKGAASWIL